MLLNRGVYHLLLIYLLPHLFSDLILLHTLASNPSLSQKTASPARQEQARLEVENAEDDLVQKTEVAITLMKTVLDNVRSYSCFFLVLFSCAWAIWLSYLRDNET